MPEEVKRLIEDQHSMFHARLLLENVDPVNCIIDSGPNILKQRIQGRRNHRFILTLLKAWEAHARRKLNEYSAES
jgi:hypothetical protein